MFNIAQLVALAADFPAASAIDLSPMTVCLILAAASLMEDDRNWQGADYDLSEEEKELIHDIVATMESEVSSG